MIHVLQMKRQGPNWARYSALLINSKEIRSALVRLSKIVLSVRHETWDATRSFQTDGNRHLDPDQPRFANTLNNIVSWIPNNRVRAVIHASESWKARRPRRTDRSDTLGVTSDPVSRRQRDGRRTRRRKRRTRTRRWKRRRRGWRWREESRQRQGGGKASSARGPTKTGGIRAFVIRRGCLRGWATAVMPCNSKVYHASCTIVAVVVIATAATAAAATTVVVVVKLRLRHGRVAETPPERWARSTSTRCWYTWERRADTRTSCTTYCAYLPPCRPPSWRSRK